MAGFAALLPTIAGAGASLLPSILGGTSPQTKAANAIATNVPSLIDKGNAATTTGLNTLGSAGNFYNTILGGNRDAITSLLNPQVGTVLSQYDNAAKTVARQAPRGGGATSTLAALPFQKATTLGSAYQTALPGAAQGAASVGSATAGIGTNLTGQAASYAPTGYDYSKLTSDQYGQLGSGFGKILAQLFQKNPGAGGASSGGGGGSSSSGGVDPSIISGGGD